MTQVMLVFSNSGGGQSLIADPTANRNVSLPDGNGTVALFPLSISAGTTFMTAGNLVLSNSNGVSWGVSGSTVTAGPLPISYWDNRNIQPPYALSSYAGQQVSFQRITFANQIAATRMDVLAHLSAVVTGTDGYRFELGIFTESNQTMAIVSSGSINVTYSNGAGSAESEYLGQSGLRWRSVPLGTWNITPGDYFLGFCYSRLGGTIAQSMSVYGHTNPQPTGVANALTIGNNIDGIYTKALGTSPFAAGGSVTTFVRNDILAGGTGALIQPYVRFVGTG